MQLQHDPSLPGACPPVRLQVLGEFHVWVEETPLAVRPAQQRLLALLAVSRRPVSRTAVSQRLWEDLEDRRGASALRSNLWRLPRPTGVPLVTSSSSHVALSPGVVVDLWEREHAAQALTRPRATPAEDTAADTHEGAMDARELRPLSDQDPVGGQEPHARWSEDLLPEWSDDWLTVERESYRQLRLHALEHLSRLFRVRGEHASALTAALAAVQADPLRESAHRQVISVHLAESNPAEALRQFHVYRRLLAHELGLPPSPAIRELVAQLLGRPLENPRRRRS
jgi:DNA-binding SARP family transcriptional activator